MSTVQKLNGSWVNATDVIVHMCDILGYEQEVGDSVHETYLDQIEITHAGLEIGLASFEDWLDVINDIFSELEEPSQKNLVKLEKAMAALSRETKYVDVLN